jgi:hypothetical protein
MNHHPEMLSRAMTLRDEVVSGNINASLLLLWDCFGLEPVESLTVLQSLKSRFSSEPHAQSSN